MVGAFVRNASPGGNPSQILEAATLKARRCAFREVEMKHSRSRLIIDGAVAGLIGGLVIAVWFFIFDAAQGEPLKTPMILASALLHGPNQVTLTSAAWRLVAEYTVVHFVAFAIIGAAAAMLMWASEEHSELFGALFLFTIGFEVFFIALVMLLGPGAQAAVSWWEGMIGNLM